MTTLDPDQRMARHPSEPDKHGPAGAPRWAAYLDWLRSDLIAKVGSLTPEQARTAQVPSGWTPIELLSHCLHMEQRWFVWGFLGEQVAEPWGDWNVEEPWLVDDADARWVVADGVTVQELSARLTEIGRRTTAVLDEFPLSATSSTGGRFGADPPTLEWICFHVVAEYARHLGHLDIVVELDQDA